MLVVGMVGSQDAMILMTGLPIAEVVEDMATVQEVSLAAIVNR